jgi:hypothetical protein
MENDNKDKNHVDDQENDMTNNSKEEEEKTVHNPPIENHDNSRRHRQSATYSFALWPFPRHLEHLSFSAHGLGWP